MAVEYAGDTASLVDHVEVTEADALLAWASAQEAPKVALDRCSHLHAANLQVLLAARVQVIAWPADAAWRDWLRHSFDSSL